MTVVFCYSRTIPRTESVLVMTSTIIFLTCMALATMLGRSGVEVLHGVASESFARSANGERNWFSCVYGKDQLLTDCENDRLTLFLRLSGEILGILAVAPLYCWSTSQERPAPFDASCAFMVTSLITFVLYVSSFSLHLNVAGEITPRSRETGCGSEADARRCSSFVCEVFSVSVGDMASLFEEANWSSCPLLGFSRGQGNQRGLDRSMHRLGAKSV